MSLLSPQNSPRRRRGVPPRGAGNSLADFRVFLSYHFNLCPLKKLLVGVSIPSILSFHGNGNENIFSSRSTKRNLQRWTPPTQPQPPKKEKIFKVLRLLESWKTAPSGREGRLQCSVWMVSGRDRRFLNALVRWKSSWVPGMFRLAFP